VFALLRTALGAGIGFIVATFHSLDETAKAVLIICVQLECRFAALAWGIMRPRNVRSPVLASQSFCVTAHRRLVPEPKISRPFRAPHT
jgi:hypothetical protein